MTTETSNARGDSTPGARWRAEGEADPHGDRYACERAALAGGDMTDDEVANAVFLEPNIVNLTIAKDRIRWLSRKLAECATPPPPAAARGDVRGLDEVIRRAVQSQFELERPIFGSPRYRLLTGPNTIFMAVHAAVQQALAAEGVQAGEVGK